MKLIFLPGSVPRSGTGGFQTRRAPLREALPGTKARRFLRLRDEVFGCCQRLPL